jgi:hypothetical protein
VAADDTSFLLADEGLWAARWSLSKLYRLDPATGAVELDVDVASPVSPTLVGDQLWLGRERLGDMVRVDRVTGAVGDVVPPGGPFGAYPYATPDSLWFTRDGTVTRIDPQTGATIATFELPAGSDCGVGGPFPDAVYAGPCFEMVATDRTFARIDPATNSVLSTTVLPRVHGAGPFIVNGQVWFLGSFDDANGKGFGGMVRVDADSGAADQWVSLGDIDPDGSLFTHDGAMWIPADGGHRIQRYDVTSLADAVQH